jgi:hypothetical protein
MGGRVLGILVLVGSASLAGCSNSGVNAVGPDAVLADVADVPAEAAADDSVSLDIPAEAMPDVHASDSPGHGDLDAGQCATATDCDSLPLAQACIGGWWTCDSGVCNYRCPGYPGDTATPDPGSPETVLPDVADSSDSGDAVAADVVAEGTAEVSCGGATPSFPSFAGPCTTDGDCTAVLHQVDCCGKFAAIGILADRQAAFATAEATCEHQYPACDCDPGQTTAQDGQVVPAPGDLGAACKAGQCSSYVFDACAAAASFETLDACTTDGDCVLGLCYDSLGTCEPMVA